MSKLTLDEAIKHCLEVAEARETEVLKYNYCRGIPDVEKVVSDCKECASDHRQLAEWLTELKELRDSLGAVKLKDMKEAVGLLQELNAENDQITLQLLEAKRLLKLAVEDANSECESLCAYCKHNDLVDGCPYIESYSECEYIWRYTDEALKLIGGSENE